MTESPTIIFCWGAVHGIAIGFFTGLLCELKRVERWFGGEAAMTEATRRQNYPVLDAEPQAGDIQTKQSEAKAKLTTEGRTGIANIPTGTMTEATRKLAAGDRVVVLAPHPWETHAGELIAYEKYGLGWMGWRVRLDGNCGECYANSTSLKKTGAR